MILSAMQKIIKREIDSVRSDVQESLIDIFKDGGNKKVSIGSAKATIGFTMNSPKFTAYEDDPEFVEFMREHGMIRETIDPNWQKVVTHAGGRVIWEETGEEVPHAYYEPESFKAMSVRISAPDEILEQAQIGGYDLRLLNGGD